MLSWKNGAVATMIAVSCTGCGTLRSIEQWKCDNWGMCMFGVQPSGSVPAIPGEGYDMVGPGAEIPVGPAYPTYPTMAPASGPGCACQAP